jgi:hypothetical protein
MVSSQGFLAAFAAFSVAEFGAASIALAHI